MELHLADICDAYHRDSNVVVLKERLESVFASYLARRRDHYLEDVSGNTEPRDSVLQIIDQSCEARGVATKCFTRLLGEIRQELYMRKSALRIGRNSCDAKNSATLSFASHREFEAIRSAVAKRFGEPVFQHNGSMARW